MSGLHLLRNRSATETCRIAFVPIEIDGVPLAELKPLLTLWVLAPLKVEDNERGEGV